MNVSLKLCLFGEGLQFLRITDAEMEMAAAYATAGLPAILLVSVFVQFKTLRAPVFDHSNSLPKGYSRLPIIAI